MLVSIDETLCIGCNLCATECPEVYEMGDDGLAKVKLASPTGALAEKAKATVPLCPVEAIKVQD